SSTASRTAASETSASVGSTAPPGKAGWPAWLRRSGARWISRMQMSPAVPWDVSSQNSRSTAEARAPDIGCAGTRGPKYARWIVAVSWTGGYNHRGYKTLFIPDLSDHDLSGDLAVLCACYPLGVCHCIRTVEYRSNSLRVGDD